MACVVGVYGNSCDSVESCVSATVLSISSGRLLGSCREGADGNAMGPLLLLVCGNVVLGRGLWPFAWLPNCGISESDRHKRCCVCDELCDGCQVWL